MNVLSPEALAFFGLISDATYLRLTAHYGVTGARNTPKHRAKVVAANKARAVARRK